MICRNCKKIKFDKISKIGKIGSVKHKSFIVDQKGKQLLIKNKGYKSIAVEKISNKGLGKAINDRLQRASRY